jgi:glycosyltransferase involved in cell wall biosynthesis
LAGELERFDLVIAHNVASLHKNLPLAAMLFEACKAGSLPPLILWHHDLAWSTPRYRRELHDGYPWDLLRSVWPCAVHVVVSEQRRSQLSSLHRDSGASIRVVPNGVDLEAFFKLEPQTTRLVKDLQLATADPLFLLPARLTPRKNIELALRILVELRHEFPRVALLITGPEGPHNPANATYRRKLLDLRDQLNLRGAAHFLAEVTDESIPDALIADFYQMADALLFPSREEGFGIPIIEAAISCKPVFCADIPVLRELGGNEVSYFPLDAEPRAIARQIADRLGSEATSRLARRAKQSYTWDSIYERHIGPLIREVVP